MPQLTPVEQAALIESLARQRLRRFRAATNGERDAIALYLLDAELAANLHAAVRFAEVALRERINWARNRISHCEPVVFGLPMPGLGTGRIRVRRSPALMFADVRTLLQLTTSDFAGWLDRWDVTHTLCGHNLVQRALDHIALDRTIRLER